MLSLPLLTLPLWSACQLSRLSHLHEDQSTWQVSRHCVMLWWRLEYVRRIQWPATTHPGAWITQCHLCPLLCASPEPGHRRISQVLHVGQQVFRHHPRAGRADWGIGQTFTLLHHRATGWTLTPSHWLRWGRGVRVRNGC